jgi:hypothetical protein
MKQSGPTDPGAERKGELVDRRRTGAVDTREERPPGSELPRQRRDGSEVHFIKEAKRREGRSGHKKK